MTEKEQLFFVSLVYRRVCFCKANNDILRQEVEKSFCNMYFII